MRVRWWSRRDRIAVGVGLLLPLAVAAVVIPFRTSLANTDAALVLVATVVVVAANGHRVAGLVAAASAAAWFDFFLTAPYDRFTIDRRGDVETTVLLIVVGAAVTEIAVRGRRQRLIATTDEAYLGAISSTVDAVDSNPSPAAVAAHVSAQLGTLLGLRRCRFEIGRFGGLPRLEPDGRVTVPEGRDWDVDQFGLPDSDVELLVIGAGQAFGRFVLSPTPGVTPPLAARRVAAILARQVAAGRPGHVDLRVVERS